MHLHDIRPQLPHDPLNDREPRHNNVGPLRTQPDDFAPPLERHIRKVRH